MTDTLYIVHWQSKDKRDYGIVGVFDDQEQAAASYELLENHGDDRRQYYLDDYALNTPVLPSAFPHQTAQHWSI